MDNLKLWKTYRGLEEEGFHWVELSREMNVDTPHWSGYPGVEIETLYDFEKNDCCFQAYAYSTAGQCGTHVDAPSHYDRTGRTLVQIPLCEMVLPLWEPL